MGMLPFKFVIAVPLQESGVGLWSQEVMQLAHGWLILESLQTYNVLFGIIDIQLLLL